MKWNNWLLDWREVYEEIGVGVHLRAFFLLSECEFG